MRGVGPNPLNDLIGEGEVAKSAEVSVESLICPKCRVQVVPTTSGECPSCRLAILPKAVESIVPEPGVVAGFRAESYQVVDWSGVHLNEACNRLRYANLSQSNIPEWLKFRLTVYIAITVTALVATLSLGASLLISGNLANDWMEYLGVGMIALFVLASAVYLPLLLVALVRMRRIIVEAQRGCTQCLKQHGKSLLRWGVSTRGGLFGKDGFFNISIDTVFCCVSKDIRQALRHVLLNWREEHFKFQDQCDKLISGVRDSLLTGPRLAELHLLVQKPEFSECRSWEDVVNQLEKAREKHASKSEEQLQMIINLITQSLGVTHT